MARRKKIEDPLDGIDPIVEQAFSVDLDEEGDRLPETFQREQKKPIEDAAPAQKRVSDPVVSDIQFPFLTPEATDQKVEVDVFSNIPVNVSVELGQTKISLKDVFELSEGSIIELERLVGEPLDLKVNGQIVAKGEVVAIDNNYGFRVTTIVSSLSK